MVTYILTRVAKVEVCKERVFDHIIPAESGSGWLDSTGCDTVTLEGAFDSLGSRLQSLRNVLPKLILVVNKTNEVLGSSLERSKHLSISRWF